MECDWFDLVARPDGEPELSVAVVEPGGAGDVLPPMIEEVAPNVDWNTLRINETYDEYEGRIEYIDDDHVFKLLGLRDEEEKDRNAADVATNKGKGPDQNTEDASLPVDDSYLGRG